MLPVMVLALILGLVKGVCGLITKRLKPHDSFSFAPQIAAACVMVLLAG